MVSIGPNIGLNEYRRYVLEERMNRTLVLYSRSPSWTQHPGHTALRKDGVGKPPEEVWVRWSVPGVAATGAQASEGRLVIRTRIPVTAGLAEKTWKFCCLREND